MFNLFAFRAPTWATLFIVMVCSTQVAAAPPTLLVVGDSISAGYGMDESDGWVNLLRGRLSEQGFPHQVINSSISGDTTSGGLNRLSSSFDRLQPSILVLELGGNDGLRGLSLKKMRKNLSAMVKLCVDNNCQPVLLGMRIPDNYGSVYTKKFQASFAQVAAQFDIPLSAFFLEGVATDSRLMQDDGIHPNEAAQEVLLETAWQLIEPLLLSAQ